MVSTLLAQKTVFILGTTNVLSILLISFTCRCMGFHKLTNRLFKYKWYQKLYSLHCYYWWALFASVIIHATLAVITFGNPF